MPTKLTPEEQDGVLKWSESFDIGFIKAQPKLKEVHYSEWQTLDFGKVNFRENLARGEYDEGIAIRTGKTISGKQYLIVLDFDGWDAIVTWFGSWDNVLALSKKTLIEWHDDTSSIHVFLFSPEPIITRRIKINGKSQLEVRCINEEGTGTLVYVSPSIHKSGEPYTALGVDTIETMQDIDMLRLKSKIDRLNDGYMSDSDKDKYIKWLHLASTILGVGCGRHDSTVTIAVNYYWRYSGQWLNLTDNQRFERAWDWHINHCKPQRPRKEFDEICKWVVKTQTAKRNAVHETQRKERKEREARESAEDLIEEAIYTILSKHHFVTIKGSETIYHYRDGRYYDDGDSVIRQTAEELYGCKLRISHRSEIKEHIRSRTFRDFSDFDSDTNIINMKNGLYNIKTNTLMPHTPVYLSINQSPLVYDPNAKPKLLWKFLNDDLYPEDIRTILELMAYTFYRDNPFEIITILLGNGSNGKGVIFGLLTALHGEANVSNVSLKSIIERPFALHDLVGKNCNLDSELSSGEIKDTAVLKKMTGRQKIRVEQKNQKAYDARLYAKPWLSANELPQTSDKTYAWFRRNVVVSCPNTFDGKNMDVNLIHKLTTPEELSGIFNVLMDIIRRVLKREGISVSAKTVEQRMVKYENAVDPVGGFLDEVIPEDTLESDKLTKEVAYASFQEYCKSKKLPIMQKKRFGASMHWHKKQDESVKQEGKTYRVWLGMKLPKEYLEKPLVKEALARTYPDGRQRSIDSALSSVPEQTER